MNLKKYILKDKYKFNLKFVWINLKLFKLKNLRCNLNNQKDIFYKIYQDIQDAKNNDYEVVINKLREINDKYSINNNISIDNLNLYYFTLLINLIVLYNEL